MSQVLRPRNEWTWLSRERWQFTEGEQMAGMMAEINALPQVLRPLSADEVIIRGMYLMNDQPMHENAHWVRKFDASAVGQTIPMVAGKPVLVNHTTDGMDGLPVGRFFRAERETRADGSTWMAALFFMLKDAQGLRLANAIDGGMIAENSPTLEFDRIYCSVCAADDMDCEHVSGKLYDGKKCYAVMTDIVDFWEGSLAWAGMQKNTGFYIASGRSAMDADEHLAALSRRREERGAMPVEGWSSYWQNSTADQEGSPGT